VPGEVPEVSGAGTWWGSGGSRWRCVVRCRRVPGQIPWGSGRFRCRDLVRLRRVLAEKVLGEVPEGSGAGTLWGSGGFWCRCFVKFQRVPMFFLWHRHLICYGISAWFLWHKHFLWQKRRSFQAVGDSTWVYLCCTSQRQKAFQDASPLSTWNEAYSMLIF